MGIKIKCMPFSDVKLQAQAQQDKILGLVCFGESHADGRNEIPNIYLNTQVLAGEHIACELWLSDIALEGANNHIVSASKGSVQYRLDGELLFGAINLDESTFTLGDSEGDSQQTGNEISPLQQATESAYRQIFALIDALGYPHLYRFWNYIADINETSHDLERYRQFNVGRKHALIQAGRHAGGDLPAACTLGLAKGPLSIAFLAGKVRAVAIENPRQIKAYDYPTEYGPLTPSFSRASLLQSGSNATLFISGTASITGHQTQHLLDVAAQTIETLLNLEAVIAQANLMFEHPRFSLQDAIFRVYIRQSEDVEVVRAVLQSHLKSELKAVFVKADICRHDLLVEIETTIQSMVETV